MPRFDTRLALMRAAEQLFAQQGVDRVSLREIAIAAGQRNVSAATYHFGSKRELIEAILERHSLAGSGRLGSGARATIPSTSSACTQLIELLVKPLVAKMDDPDGGRCYLELCAELVASRSFPLMGMRVATTPGAQEMAKRIAEHGPEVPPMIRVIRSTRLAGHAVRLDRRLPAADQQRRRDPAPAVHLRLGERAGGHRPAPSRPTPPEQPFSSGRRAAANAA